MKNFITMSREQAKRYTYKNASRDYIIISINDITETSTKPPRFNRNSHLKGVLRLYFDDISKHIKNYVLMSNDDAINIFNFIEKYNNVNNIIIHCTAGVSRSVSIKSALEECYNNRKIGVFSKNERVNNKDTVGLDELLEKKDNDIYILNKWCYNMIKNVYRSKLRC